MFPKDGPVSLAEHAGRGHVGAFPQSERLAPDDPCHGEPFDHAEAQDQDDKSRRAHEPLPSLTARGKLEAFVEGIDEDEDEDQPGHRIEDIDQAHHRIVGAATRGSGDQPVGGSDEEADSRAADADQQGDSSAFHDPEEQIPAVHVGAAGMGNARRGVGEGRGESVGIRKRQGSRENKEPHAREH